jgi:CheY-like chemotaxis protein
LILTNEICLEILNIFKDDGSGEEIIRLLKCDEYERIVRIVFCNQRVNTEPDEAIFERKCTDYVVKWNSENKDVKQVYLSYLRFLSLNKAKMTMLKVRRSNGTYL